MSDLAKKMSRQTIILGLAMRPENEHGCTQEDLIDLFGVESATIQRDLKDLRFEGIIIGSRRRKGIRYEAGLDEQQALRYISTFAGLTLRHPSVDKATALTVQRHGVKALYMFVALQQSIEQKLRIHIEYEKSARDIKKRIVEPVDLFVNEGQWRLLARENSVVKQYLLVKILSITETTESFRPADGDELSLFKNSWGSWMGPEEYNVKLHFDLERSAYIRPKRLIENQRIEEQPDGTVIFTATVNSLREIGTWVLGWGRGCTVLEPPALKDLVIRLATETLAQYKQKP